MAGNDSQKQFLTLIRDFASEKSQGERRIIDQKKRIQELQSELEIANAEVEEAKNRKKIAEQELKGYEVELARNDSAIQTLEEGIAFIQDELTAYGFDLEALKKKDADTRDEFIEKMLELNAKIRKFHESIASIFRNDSNSASKPASRAKAKAEDAEAFERDLQNELAQIVSQITKEEEECQVEQNIHRQVEEELSILERKASLIEAITKENMEMQELASKQTSELENRCSFLGDELQRRSVCLRCHKDNVEALGQILQAGDEN